MNTRRMEQDLLSIRQHLTDGLNLVTSQRTINLSAFRSITKDLDYCNYLLKLCRNQRFLMNIS